MHSYTDHLQVLVPVLSAGFEIGRGVVSVSQRRHQKDHKENGCTATHAFHSWRWAVIPNYSKVTVFLDLCSQASGHLILRLTTASRTRRESRRNNVIFTIDTTLQSDHVQESYNKVRYSSKEEVWFVALVVLASKSTSHEDRPSRVLAQLGR